MTKKKPETLKEKLAAVLEESCVQNFLIHYQNPDDLTEEHQFKGTAKWLHGVGYFCMQMSEEIMDRHIDLLLGGENDE